MNIEEIAKITHELNKAYCESTNDFSQVAWDYAPEWQKASAIAGVKFHLNNPGSLPEDSHQNWLEEKEADGWVYGEVKDSTLKTHPCCVPFFQLTRAQRSKDYLFTQTVKSLSRFLDSLSTKMIKLEVGKSYVLKDVENTIKYVNTDPGNAEILEEHYDNRTGFTIEAVDADGNGWVVNDVAIRVDGEIEFFKKYEPSALRSELKS